MTEAVMQAILDRIAYKPGWRLSYSWDKSDRYIQWSIEDAEAPTGMWSCRKWRISPHMTASELVQTAFLAVMTAEEHETREKFTYDGVAVLGPHWDLTRIVDLTRRGELFETVRMEPRAR